MRHIARALVIAVAFAVLPALASGDVVTRAFPLPNGGGAPHDVAVGTDGIVWYTAQHNGNLGRLDPTTGTVDLIPLGRSSSPHGVIIGPDGAPWVTDSGMNAIVRVDAKT